MKALRTKSDFDSALARFDELMEIDPDPGTPEDDEYEILSVLIDDYQKRNDRIGPPDPVEAIKFRMEQQGLTRRDLEPILGTRSRVSEILNKKRDITLDMVRALHRELGIPLESLVADTSSAAVTEVDVDWAKFPVPEMAKLGWIKRKSGKRKDIAEELVRPFLLAAPVPNGRLALRQTPITRTGREMDPYALTAWSARVLTLAAESEAARVTSRPQITRDFISDLARLSIKPDGPAAAIRALAEAGIPVVIQPHLQKTFLDGAAFLMNNGIPVIGLTLRYDRIDNFWFTLAHELAHIALHIRRPEQAFYDDLNKNINLAPEEKEADEFARDCLIPPKVWRDRSAEITKSKDAVLRLATKIKRHPGIVAGRLRYESTYRVHSRLVGNREVRKLFPEVKFP